MSSHNSIYSAFGIRLRKLRQEKGITQENLANKVSYKRTTITNIELGNQKVLLHQVIELAEALEVPVSELLKFSSNDFSALITASDLSEGNRNLFKEILGGIQS